MHNRRSQVYILMLIFLGAGMTVKLLFNIISSIFDYNPNVATCMKAEMWQEWVEASFLGSISLSLYSSYSFKLIF